MSFLEFVDNIMNSKVFRPIWDANWVKVHEALLIILDRELLAI